MSEQNNKSPVMIIALVVVIALIAVGAYFSIAGKKTDTTAPQTAETTTPAGEDSAMTSDEPAVTGEVPPQPETPENVVVETKKLEVPGAEETPAPAEEVAAAPASGDLAAMMAPRSIGKASAPIKVTEWSSLTCGHCAHFHKDVFPTFKEKFIDTGKVQLTFKEFPLNPPALDASQILRCMPEDKFVSFMNLLFEEQDNWAFKADYKDSLRQSAKLAGMSDEQFDKCLANTELKNRIVADMKTAGDKYKIQSTPSFVVNDGKDVVVGVQPIEFFEKTFDKVSGGASAPAATEPSAAPAQ